MQNTRMTKLIPYDATRRAEAVRMVAEFFADHFSVSEYTEVAITPERLQAADEDFDDWLEKDSATVFFIEDNGVINTILTSIGLEPLKMINTQGAVIFGMVYNFLP